MKDEPPQHDAPFDWEQAKKDGWVWSKDFGLWLHVPAECGFEPFTTPGKAVSSIPVVNDQSGMGGRVHWFHERDLLNMTDPRQPARPEPQVVEVWPVVREHGDVHVLARAPNSYDALREHHVVPYGCRSEESMLELGVSIRHDKAGQWYASKGRPVTEPRDRRIDAVVDAENYIRQQLEGSVR